MATSKPTAKITQRKVKNQETGVDINVPSHVAADSPRNVKYFHVVVISRLPHFKLPEHSETDVVQFMVLRDYEAIEKLQKELVQQYPELKLPMPRKYFIFMDEEDLEDRRVSFDCLLTVIAKNKELCTSIPVLMFLGIDILADRKYVKRRKEYLSQTMKAETERSDLQQNDQEDLFANRGSKVSAQNENISDEFEEDLFKDDPKSLTKHSEENSERLSSVKVSLLSDDIEVKDAILVGDQESEKKDSLFHYEEDSELNRITDSLDDVLELTQSKPKNPKGKASSQPSKKAIKTDLFDDSPNEVSVMGTTDVMDYIKQNENSADDDLSLF